MPAGPAIACSCRDSACNCTWRVPAGCATYRSRLPARSRITRAGRGWRRELAAALRGIEVPWNLAGVMLLSVGSALMIWLAWAIIHDPQAIARTVFEMLDMK